LALETVADRTARNASEPENAGLGYNGTARLFPPLRLSPRDRTMPRELSVVTPENVEINHLYAGIGTRFVALMIDHCLQVFLMATIVIGITLAVTGTGGLTDAWSDGFNLTGWAMGAVVVATFLLFWGYFILFETIWNGQTPGKRAVRIRVIKENGRSIDFFSAAIRNIVRILDMLPGIYAFGVISMFFSPAYKRIGDYAAGTIVVKEYRPDPPDGAKPRKGRSSRDADWSGATPFRENAEEAERETVPGVSIEGIGRVTREEYEAARRFLDRRGELPDGIANDLAKKISLPILDRLEMTPEDLERYPYGLFLDLLAQDYLKRQDLRF
jgi:uncharacterized RDD family membrane protein YckC